MYYRSMGRDVLLVMSRKEEYADNFHQVAGPSGQRGIAVSIFQTIGERIFCRLVPVDLKFINFSKMKRR